MSFEDFQKYVQHERKYLKTERIGLLGGEPTTHPEFEQFLEYSLKNFATVSLFTNLMAPRRNQDALLNLAKKYPNLRTVWNNSEFDYSSKLHLESIEVATELAKVSTVRHSLTYTPGLNTEYLIDMGKKTNIYNIRFAIDVASMAQVAQDNEMVFLINQLENLQRHGFSALQDGCGFIPKNIKYRFRLRLAQILVPMNQCYGNAGADILPDGRVIPCLPYLEEPKDLFLCDVKSMADLKEQYIKYYGPQAHDPHQTSVLCPAKFNPNGSSRAKKTIPITIIR